MTTAIAPLPIHPGSIAPVRSDTDSSHSADKIRKMVEEARCAITSGVHKAVIAGQMLQEKRSQYKSLCHSDTKISIDEAPDPTFKQWVTKAGLSISPETARRWMAAAKRVMCVLLKIEHPSHADSPIWIESEGDKVHISAVLTMPASECSAEMLAFRQSFNDFIADKTLGEASAAAVDGDSPAHRITLAANGKTDLAGSGNRRAYAKFVGVHLKAISGIQQKWDKLQTRDPVQFVKMSNTLSAFVLGGSYALVEKGRPIDLPPMNLNFAKLLMGLLKERLKENR